MSAFSVKKIDDSDIKPLIYQKKGWKLLPKKKKEVENKIKKRKTDQG